MSRKALPFALVLIAALSAGCGSAGNAGAGDPGARTARNSNVLTAAEMTETRLPTVYDAVDRLRPRWLQIRGQSSVTGSSNSQIVVYLNTKYLGGPEALREFAPNSITEVRYLDGPRAAATLQGYPDGQHVAGGIVIVTGDGR